MAMDNLDSCLQSRFQLAAEEYEANAELLFGTVLQYVTGADRRPSCSNSNSITLSDQADSLRALRCCVHDYSAELLGSSTEVNRQDPIMTCAVCLSVMRWREGGEEEVGHLRRCGHMFHKACIHAWISSCRHRTFATCPLCRARLISQ
ncbi:hypothetical protein L7F22_014451 [Adiantum nelumboides]|nr:hypothetical protein [Adiantum nelumboides]